MTDASAPKPTDDRPPRGIDTSVPHSARVWNYWLGGNDYYEIDRQVGDRVRAVYLGIVDLAQQSRAFLGRAVRYLTGEVGIRQFLDIGIGLPTADNTHEVAQRIAPESKIVYVDNDPLVLVFARALLTSARQGVCDYLDADVQDPDTILRGAAQTLDFDRPIGLMLLGIMGKVFDDEEAYAIERRLVDALAPGSHVVFEDGTKIVHPEASAKAELRRAEGGDPYRLRTPEQVAPFFDGLDVLEPGIVLVSQWRPEAMSGGEPELVDALCAVARKS